MLVLLRTPLRPVLEIVFAPMNPGDSSRPNRAAPRKVVTLLLGGSPSGPAYAGFRELADHIAAAVAGRAGRRP
jgi:hypothetical protein